MGMIQPSLRDAVYSPLLTPALKGRPKFRRPLRGRLFGSYATIGNSSVFSTGFDKTADKSTEQ
jgi:hypothetical protein